MSDMKKAMKLKALKSLKKEMLDEMGEGFKPHMSGLKKVTVASDSEEGLKKGLSKAEQIMEARSKMSDEDMEDEEMENHDCGDMKSKKKK